MDSEKYESIRDKLRKLQALAEGGCGGEAQAAKRAIDRLCRQYNISIEDVLKEELNWYSFEVGGRKYLKDLFFQCYFYITGQDTASYKQYNRSVVRLELTPMQYVELQNLYSWHKENFMRELQEMQKTILTAYVNKHDLFSHNNANSNKSLSEDDIIRLRKALVMMESLGDNYYHKQIEN